MSVATVMVKSRFFPDGKEYALRSLADCDERELRSLNEIARRAARAATGAPGLLNLTVSRALGRAVAIVVPDLEAKVLRRMPDDAREAILNLWAEVNA